MKYPASYHAACNHLVAFGGHRYAKKGRAFVAKALRDLRNALGRERARHERLSMMFISGHFPVKTRNRR